MMKSILLVLIMSSMPLSKANSEVNDKELLTAKEQSIVVISAFTANGDLINLSKSLHEGLNAGLTISEIKEVIVQLYAYAGFPRSLNALHAFMDVLKERKSKGINDIQGKTVSPYPANKSNLEFGTENQTRLVGTPVKGEVYEFAPAIDQFLKEHLFGDIFGRDILDYKTREIATVAALASLSGTENQLRSHFNVGMHNGLTKAQLTNLVAIIESRVGEREGYIANTVLQKILNPSYVEIAADAHPDGEKIVSNNFTGTARLQMLVQTDSVFQTQIGRVTFEPGARTNWHYHPSGQILYIINGSAYYQEKGKPKEILSKGDVIKCAPNVQHWHGATPSSSMTHVVVSSNMELGSVVWLDKVSDKEYNQ